MYTTFAAVSAIHPPDMRWVVGTTAAIVLRLVIKQAEELAYVEFPEGEPMANVLNLIRAAETQGVYFDLLDPDLWEYPEGGVRIHGFFKESIV